MSSKTNQFKIDFIGVGAAKSGTTWLADCLSAHPDVFLPDRKELYYFDLPEGRNYSKGFAWYQSFFKPAKSGQVIGEFTNHYMYLPQSAGLIHAHFPKVKIIACLRNPVTMAYSLYWWRKSNIEHPDIQKTFKTAFKKDPQYVSRGLYFKQLKPYFDLFGKRNVKVVLYEDIKRNPDKVLKDLYKFLGVNQKFIPNRAQFVINKTKKVRNKKITQLLNSIVKFTERYPRLNFKTWDLLSNVKLARIYWKLNKKDFNYPKMKKKEFEQAYYMFRSDINKLEKLIGKDLSHWKSFDRI